MITFALISLPGVDTIAFQWLIGGDIAPVLFSLN